MALARGVWDVDAVLAETDSETITQWLAYEQVEPWGGGAEDWRAGVLAAMLANQWRSSGRPARPSDFFPSLLDLDHRPMTPRQAAAQARKYVEQSGGRVVE